jgi:hypothetical protein
VHKRFLQRLTNGFLCHGALPQYDT